MKRIGKLVACVLIAISALSVDNMDYENRQPDMVSTISSMNYEYCAIIAYRNQIPDKMHSAGLDGHGCVFQRPHCGAKRPHVITDFPLLLS